MNRGLNWEPDEHACCCHAGNTATSWSDVLMGELPNVYVYAANNPSESIVAKRRGYATIVSHNVPPYGRHAMCPCGFHKI